MLETSIKGDNGFGVTLVVQGYMAPSRTNSPDDNWLNATVGVQGGAFTGSFDTLLVTHDFVDFAKNLARVLEAGSGQASFTTIEGGILIEISLTDRGTGKVRATATKNSGPRATLEIHFETDRTYLIETLSECRKILVAYPVR